MKKLELVCSLCKRVYTDAPESAVGLICEREEDEGGYCQGMLMYNLPYRLPMVGDPDRAYGDPRHRGFLIYQAAIAQKHGIVPESLRRGLWVHIW